MILAIRIVATGRIWKVVLCYSVGEFERLQCLPPAAQPLVHGCGQFQFAVSESLDGRRNFGDRLIGAERGIVKQVDKAAVVEFYQRMRMELLQPSPDLGKFRVGLGRSRPGRAAQLTC